MKALLWGALAPALFVFFCCAATAEATNTTSRAWLVLPLVVLCTLGGRVLIEGIVRRLHPA
jgi:hypothetical protein